MNLLKKMILTVYPSANENDFIIGYDNGDKTNPYFKMWNSAKLGAPHSFIDIHKSFIKIMKYRNQNYIDPMPWL